MKWIWNEFVERRLAQERPLIRKRDSDWFIQVKRVILHECPHLDEIFALYLLIRYGKHIFLGIENALKVFTKETVACTDATNKVNGDVVLGCAPGTMFDEHLPDGFGVDRMEGDCTAMRVLSFLNLEERPELKYVARDVLYYDEQPKCTSAELPEQVKIGHSLFKGDSLKAMRWTFKALDAIVDGQEHQLLTNPKYLEKVPGEKTLLEHFESERFTKRYSDNPHFAPFMRELVEKSMRMLARPDSERGKVLGLAYIVRCMYIRAHIRRESTEDVGDYVLYAFDSMYTDQFRFRHEEGQCERIFLRPGTDVEALRAGKLPRAKAYGENAVRIRWLENTEEKPAGSGTESAADNGRINRPDPWIYLFPYQSDSRHAHKSAWYLRAHVCLAMRSTGNVQIFTNRKWSEISLDRVVEMVRFLEIPAERQPLIDWRRLCWKGRYPGETRWYYTAGTLYNGSDTHNAEPQTIGYPALIDALTHAFHPTLVMKWWRKHRINYDASMRSGTTVYIPELGKLAAPRTARKPASRPSDVPGQAADKNKSAKKTEGAPARKTSRTERPRHPKAEKSSSGGASPENAPTGPKQFGTSLGELLDTAEQKLEAERGNAGTTE